MPLRDGASVEFPSERVPIPTTRERAGGAIAWMWTAAVVTLVAAWAAVLRAEPEAPRFGTFVALCVLVSAGPAAATWCWARGRRRSGRRAGEGMSTTTAHGRNRRLITSVWISVFGAAIVGSLVIQGRYPEAAPALPIAVATLIALPAVVYTALTRPDASGNTDSPRTAGAEEARADDAKRGGST